MEKIYSKKNNNKPRIIFISDVHLCMSKPKITKAFLNFLKKEAICVNALYILGDLFEFWIGEDDQKILINLIIKPFINLKKKGVDCFLIKGNRDFLINEKFFYLTGISLLPEKCIIKIYGKKILILHGDTLCKKNFKYHIFKNIKNNLWIQKIFLLLPLFLRKKILFFYIKLKNIKFNNHIQQKIIKDAVIRVFIKYKVNYMIHGHIHNILLQKIKFRNLIFNRFTLGHWDKNGSMIYINRKKINLITFNL